MPNRLASETSPYLLQHADNPVEWYPWGEEALERARSEDRPILLSIGYSACHWCHVMERESFEDEETARLMNETFVNVKVDREERPDLDSIYMRAVQALTGRGGWPLTAFLTPAGEPYYGGTYFPPEPRHGMPSFRQVLTAARDAWRDRPEDVADAAGQLRGLLERSTAGGRGRSEAAALTPPVLDSAYRSLAGSFDPVHGGFGSAPKFPQPVVLEFLLRSHVRTGEPAPLTMVTHTLRSMARGGVRDHLAGGFHRYAVDARWLVPHFEKMLYDNALLARVYLNAWQLTREPDLREVAEEILDYLLDDLRSAEGGFFAARDADSEGEEGRYYVWSAEEVDGVLERAEARLFRRVYDVSESGNFEGSNILHLPHDLDAVARAEGTEPAELKARLRAARERLLERRGGRPEPLKDTKVLTGWNGMTARALAEAGGALDREDYREAAAACADFLLQRLREGDRLLHVWTDGRAKVDGFLEDYGALGNALLTLWETTLDPRWLPEIRWTCDRVVELFWDPEEEAFYDAPEGGERLVVRPRDPMDTATPSGTSLAVELLLRAAALFGNEDWSRLASRALLGEADGMARFPSAFGRLLSCADRHLAAPVEVAVLGPPVDPRTRALHRAALRPWLPNRVLAGADPGAAGELGLPLLSGRGLRDGAPAAYVCRNYACGEPVTEAEALEEQLGPSGSVV